MPVIFVFAAVMALSPREACFGLRSRYPPPFYFNQCQLYGAYPDSGTMVHPTRICDAALQSSPLHFTASHKASVPKVSDGLEGCQLRSVCVSQVATYSSQPLYAARRANETRVVLGEWLPTFGGKVRSLQERRDY